MKKCVVICSQFLKFYPFATFVMRRGLLESLKAVAAQQLSLIGLSNRARRIRRHLLDHAIDALERFAQL
jgi:hypothetical protein